MSGRAAILQKIRRASAVADETERRAAVLQRLNQPETGIVPERGTKSGMAALEQFAAIATALSATVEIISEPELAQRCASYLRAHNLPLTLRMGGDRRLAAIDWSAEPTLMIAHGRSDGNDLATLSHAFAAIAETGTLCLISGPDNPTTLNFLPDHHLVVIRQSDIAPNLETVLAQIRALGVIPRTVNLISGPSRSADIEQKLILGAHGPRALHILILKDDLH